LTTLLLVVAVALVLLGVTVHLLVLLAEPEARVQHLLLLEHQ
jgi:hypothetical protein